MTQVFPTNFPPSNTPIVDDKGGMSNVGMAFFRALYDRTGAGNGLVNQVFNGPGGTLTDDWNYLNGTPNSTLPALTGGQMVMVQNSSGSIATITAPSGATIDGVATYSLANTKMQIFWFLSSTQIISTQLG
jgi:hypothetical protein